MWYSQMTAVGVKPNRTVQIIAIGMAIHEGTKIRVVACDEAGKGAWSADCSGIFGFASGDLNGDGNPEWVFPETNASLVVASTDGKRLSSLPVVKPRVRAFVVAAEPSGRGTLVVLQEGNTLSAYRFQ
jgi:hypothetical protein